MYLLNKVRHLSSGTLYEIVKYDLANSDTMTVYTVGKDRLAPFLQSTEKDFNLKQSTDGNSYLLSSAESLNVKLFDSPEFSIETEASLFTLLAELVNKNAFFIPCSLFRKGYSYKGDEISNFHNIRVSSSSMYLGFSLIRDGSWVSSRLMGVSEKTLFSNTFYIALPIKDVIETCELPIISVEKVNEQICNIYQYDNNLPLIPKSSPNSYFPLPLINYLNFNYCIYVNTLRVFSDLFQSENGIIPSQRDYIVKEPTTAIAVKGSIKNISGKRRIQLLDYYSKFNGNIKDFISGYKLNLLEAYAITLLDGTKSIKTMSGIFDFMKQMRIKRSLYSLALMRIRCQLFSDPFIFPEMTKFLVAKGGGGGDLFYTAIGKVY